MKPSVFGGTLAFLIGLIPSAAAAGQFVVSPNVAHEINLTTDSSPGWVPTADQRLRALVTVQAYLDAIEDGRYDDAYGLFSDLLKGDQTLAQFKQEEQKFKALAGPLKIWKVLKVTWTKDPAQAPSPGIYVAIDIAGQFVNVDRDCGYIVLYQSLPGGDLTVMRREQGFLENAIARQIEAKQSKAEVVKAWAKLSGYCPNYDPSLAP